jgi:hypothetical protein
MQNRCSSNRASTPKDPLFLEGSLCYLYVLSI